MTRDTGREARDAFVRVEMLRHVRAALAASEPTS